MRKMDRTGERRLMNCGEYATIIRYGGVKDIDVKFDSGETVYNRDHSSFVKGTISKPKVSRLGQRRLMNCGEYATIVRYASATDIDVQFDSGETAYNKTYRWFLTGSIAKPSQSRIGERRLMNCGEYATIIEYRTYTDIDIKFDSGEIVRNKSYRFFKSGSIPKFVQDRVGERRLMNCGEYATIIRYGSYKDIDVKFDSGEIIYNKTYTSFINGSIPKFVQDRVGERRLMTCGEYATIIRYGSYKDIDVKFDSGEIKYNRDYHSFSKGNIAKTKVNRIGERRLMNCGEYATIIRYGNNKDIDIKFDSGEIAYNRAHSSFVKGNIAKPKVARVDEKRLMLCGLYARIIRYGGYSDIDIKFESGDIMKAYDYLRFCNGCCNPIWYNHRTMRKCYYDKVLNDVIILMKDGSIKRKSELLGGIE